MNNSHFVRLFSQGSLDGVRKVRLGFKVRKGHEMCVCVCVCVCVYMRVQWKKVGSCFSLEDKGRGQFKVEIVCKGDEVLEVKRERIWIRSAAPVLSAPREPPSGSGFGVNISPTDLFLPQGTQTPGLPIFHFYFPGCKMPLAIRAGVFFFSFFFFPFLYLLIKCVLVEPKKPS